MQGSLYAFFIGFGIAHLFRGSLSDVYGRRIIMLIGIMVFCLSTIGCIFTRDIYGAERTTKAMSNVIILFVPVTIIMPMLGGFLYTHAKWNTAFWVMEVFGILALLATSIFLMETAPVKPGTQKRGTLTIGVLKDVLGERSFLRNTISNMFGFTSVLIFLAAFGASLATGAVIVRLLVPRFTVEGSIYLGISFSLLSWIIILITSHFLFSSFHILTAIICVATIGLGIVFTLTPGQAMVPFTKNSGTASALYGILQYGGASTIAYLTRKTHNGNMPLIISIITGHLEKSLIKLGSSEGFNVAPRST